MLQIMQSCSHLPDKPSALPLPWGAGEGAKKGAQLSWKAGRASQTPRAAEAPLLTTCPSPFAHSLGPSVVLPAIWD